MAKQVALPTELLSAMREAGIPVDECRRVVIDIQVGDVPIVYTEQYGNKKLINIVRALTEVRIDRAAPDDSPETESGVSSSNAIERS